MSLKPAPSYPIGNINTDNFPSTSTTITTTILDTRYLNTNTTDVDNSQITLSNLVLAGNLTLPNPTSASTVPSSLQLGYLYQNWGTWTSINNYTSGTSTATQLFTYPIQVGTWIITVNLYTPQNTNCFYANWNTVSESTITMANHIVEAKCAGDSNTAGTSRNALQMQFTYQCDGLNWTAPRVVGSGATLQTNTSPNIYLLVLTNYAVAGCNYNIQGVRIA